MGAEYAADGAATRKASSKSPGMQPEAGLAKEKLNARTRSRFHFPERRTSCGCNGVDLEQFRKRHLLAERH